MFFIQVVWSPVAVADCYFSSPLLVLSLSSCFLLSFMEVLLLKMNCVAGGAVSSQVDLIFQVDFIFHKVV